MTIPGGLCLVRCRWIGNLGIVSWVELSLMASVMETSGKTDDFQ